MHQFIDRNLKKEMRKRLTHDKKQLKNQLSKRVPDKTMRERQHTLDKIQKLRTLVLTVFAFFKPTKTSSDSERNLLEFKRA